MNGWIKLHRKMMDWEWYSDSQTVHLFLHLLFSAAHKDGEWRGIPVKRGQVVFGRKRVAAATGISERAIRTRLLRLKTTSELTIKTTNRYSMVTILKYDEYQTALKENDHQYDQPAVTKTTTSEEVKKLRSTTTANAADDFRFMEFWTRYPRKVNRPAAFKAWKKKNCGNGLFKEVMEGLDRYLCGPWKGKEKQFIPHGSSWINGERWNDEIDTGLSETCFVDCGVCKYNQDPNFPCRNLFCDTFDHSTCKSFRTVGDA